MASCVLEASALNLPTNVQKIHEFLDAEIQESNLRTHRGTLKRFSKRLDDRPLTDGLVRVVPSTLLEFGRKVFVIQFKDLIKVAHGLLRRLDPEHASIHSYLKSIETQLQDIKTANDL